MGKTTNKANEVVKLLRVDGKTVAEAKNTCTDNDEWHRVSSKAYNLFIDQAKKKRKEDEKKSHVSATSNKVIVDLLVTNDVLADYALFVPAFATMPELNYINKLIIDLPQTEISILKLLGDKTMSPMWRIRQKKGRIQHFQIFKEFTKLIDAATLSYYRTNYISSYLTLAPVIEGIILRWMGFDGTGEKPEFEEIKKFFRFSHRRQPCPGNVLFYDVYTKVCNKILNEHLYKPSQSGASYANFNRHLAAHLLYNAQFATKENCVRLFMLIDAMTEIYYYETYISDPRFSLKDEDTKEESDIYINMIIDQAINQSPEEKILGS
jgi:hypothetical protein